MFPVQNHSDSGTALSERHRRLLNWPYGFQ